MDSFGKKVYRVIKRLLDILFCIIGLVFAFIPMIIISILIKLDDKGPVLFKQKRTGYKGKEFNLYKFRTMTVNNDVHDFKHKDQHTKIGTVLRKLSLDELPQMINILKGDMSFIGPRPWITDYWKNMNDEQRHRCDVLPGITGLAQAKGRNNITIFDKINYDLEYIRDYSFIEDVKVIFLTIKTVLSKSGADAGKDTIHNELEELHNSNAVNA